MSTTPPHGPVRAGDPLGPARPGASLGGGCRARRVLITANPQFGHVNAVLPVAQAALRLGHEVVLATGPDLVPHVTAHGVPARPSGPTFADSRARHGERWLELFAATAAERAHDLVPLALQWQPDIVIHDETELAGVVAAQRCGAMHVVHGLSLTPRPPVQDALSGALAQLGEQWGVADLADGVAEATYLDLAPAALRPAHGTIWPRVEALRPTAPDPVEAPRLPASLSNLPFGPSIYVTLGTVFNDRSSVLERVIDALADLEANLIVTSGPGSDPSRFGPQPPHVVIEPYIPQTAILPGCELVVSQGGAGCMFATLAHGLPQLMLPLGADQFVNADACVGAGAALALGPDEATERAVRSAAEQLLRDPAFAQAARTVRHQLAEMPDPDHVVATLAHRAGRTTH